MAHYDDNHQHHQASNGNGNGHSEPPSPSANGYHKSGKKSLSLKRKFSVRSIFTLSDEKRSALRIYAVVSTLLLVRSYLSGISAAGRETWYPVPLIGFVRSELALACALLGSLPFLFLVLGWTELGIITLPALAVKIPHYVMPGPVPMPVQAKHCFGIQTALLALICVPVWRRPTAAVVVFLALAVLMPYIPEQIKPLYSSYPVEMIPNQVINLNPSMQEDVGAAALESGPLLDFVWENRQDWVKVSHGRALGYFVFGKNFNHDQQWPILPQDRLSAIYSLRRGFRLSSYRDTWGESDFRLHFPEKRKRVSDMFKEEFGTSLANIYSRVLNVDPETIVLGDMGALSKMENMGFPAVKVVFPSLFWHWFNNPHTDSYLYQMEEIDGNKCDKARQRTFLIPLTEPPGAGLYYWYKNGTRMEVDYKVGNVYSFEVSVLHAIRPFPYHEWKHGMKDARVTIQAFGIPCGDNWYITH